MHYALFLNEKPVYETRQYTNYPSYELFPSDNLYPLEEGRENIVYIRVDGIMVPVESGEPIFGYDNAIQFSGNIAMSGGEAEAREFGLNLGDYSAVLVLAKGSIPIDETSVIWYESKPQYNEDGTVDEHTADYTVVKYAPSINVDRYALKKVVKQWQGKHTG